MKILIIEDEAIVAHLEKMWITKVNQYPGLIFPNGLELSHFSGCPSQLIFI